MSNGRRGVADRCVEVGRVLLLDVAVSTDAEASEVAANQGLPWILHRHVARPLTQAGMSWDTARFLNGTQPGSSTSTAMRVCCRAAWMKVLSGEWLGPW